MPIVEVLGATIEFPDEILPDEVRQILGNAFSDFAGDLDTATNHLSRLAEGSVIVGMVRNMRPEDRAALGTSMIPVVGDALGAYADYTDIKENWDDVPWLSKVAMGGAALIGAIPILPSRAQIHAGAGALGDVARQKITAYHGSPHDFDKFSTAQIGTGEGAQAYGHGLYFAESEDVARGYRDQLSKNFDNAESRMVVSIGDQKISLGHFGDDKNLGDAIESDEIRSELRRYAEAWDDDASLSPSDFDMDELLGDIIRNSDSDATVSEAKALLGNSSIGIESGGRMYEVNIDASPDEFLDWDLPLSEQSDRVKNYLRGLESSRISEAVNNEPKLNSSGDYWEYMGNTYESKADALEDFTTQNIVHSNRAGIGENPTDVSASLKNSGIKGIRYKDGFSRGADGGSSNYVVFDENLITISKKYGIAIPAAAAMLAKETGQDPATLYEEGT